MILSVNVPQMVNGSDAGSLSFSLEGMSQEEVVGIYGREEMTISFEADSGSCMGSEKGYVSFFFQGSGQHSTERLHLWFFCSVRENLGQAAKHL